MKTKIPIKIDLEKIKSALTKTIKEQDPLQKWLPSLNELKPLIDEAQSTGVSLKKIREVLVENGLKIPPDLLKKFISLNEKKN